MLPSVGPTSFTTRYKGIGLLKAWPYINEVPYIHAHLSDRKKNLDIQATVLLISCFTFFFLL